MLFRSTVIFVVFLITAIFVKVDVAPLPFFTITMIKIICINCEFLNVKLVLFHYILVVKVRKVIQNAKSKGKTNETEDTQVEHLSLISLLDRMSI